MFKHSFNTDHKHASFACKSLHAPQRLGDQASTLPGELRFMHQTDNTLGLWSTTPQSYIIITYTMWTRAPRPRASAQQCDSHYRSHTATPTKRPVRPLSAVLTGTNPNVRSVATATHTAPTAVKAYQHLASGPHLAERVPAGEWEASKVPTHPIPVEQRSGGRCSLSTNSCSRA